MCVENDIRQAWEAIQAADALLISAGAGMGVDSGLPDFRGTQGFWRAYPALEKLGLSFEEMANPTWFKTNPHLAWAFYGHRLDLYRRTIPHPGFNQLLEWCRAKQLGYGVFTSNVDGQFQRAGFAAERIVECHGSIHHFQCSATCTDAIWDADAESVRLDEATFRALEPLPRCRQCAAIARPNVLMFDDSFWLRHRTSAQQARWSSWLDSLAQASANLVVIELGAGSAIPTVRITSQQVARRFAATLIRINPWEADVPKGQIGLPFGSAEGLRRIRACAS